MYTCTPGHPHCVYMHTVPMTTRHTPLTGHLPPLITGHRPPLLIWHLPPLITGHRPPLLIGHLPLKVFIFLVTLPHRDCLKVPHPQSTSGLLLSFCQQIALAMHYLSTRGFVHCDLAARSVFVSEDNICKACCV